MTAKKKTLIELMLDAGVKPEKIEIECNYLVCDYRPSVDAYVVSRYVDVPLFCDKQWSPDCGFISFIGIELREPSKNWKRTIITKQQFVDAYNEKNKPVGKLDEMDLSAGFRERSINKGVTNIPEDKQVEDIPPLNVVIENNTQHAIHADLSDIDTEKFKREFHEAGKRLSLTPAHYSVVNGKDLIARSAESYKVDEFRGAMRFNIEKYIDRLGKKDSLVKELRKIADYANRWADYEEKLQGSK